MGYPYMVMLKNALNRLKGCKVVRLKSWLTHHFSKFPYLHLMKDAFTLKLKNKEKGTKSCHNAKQPYNLPTFEPSSFSKYLLIYSFTYLLIGCSGGTYTPKPAGYPRIDLPKKEYVDFNSSECGFSFRVPKYAVVEQDKSRGAEACWYNLDFPQFAAKVHMSYKPVSSFKNFYEMSEDAHTFAYKHTVKAEDIYDSAFYFKNNRTSGFLFSIEGNTASAIQFYATDSNKHYLRGALYFNAQPNKDSLQPVVNFIRADIDTLLKSLRWR